MAGYSADGVFQQPFGSVKRQQILFISHQHSSIVIKTSLFKNSYTMITGVQLKAARALLGIDQRTLAEAADLSLPTIQRMEGSDGDIRGNIDSLVKLIAALETAGIELIGEGVVSEGGGRGVRLKS